MSSTNFPKIENVKSANFGPMKLQRDRLTWEDGAETHYEYRTASRDLLNIIAMNDKEELIFVHQYRHPIREWTLEPAGGGVYETESVWEAALRIMRAETGYSALAANIFPLGKPLALAPTAMEHVIHTVFIHGVAHISEPNTLQMATPIVTEVFPVRDVIRDPIATLSEFGHVPMHTLGSLMLARRAIHDVIN